MTSRQTQKFETIDFLNMAAGFSKSDIIGHSLQALCVAEKVKMAYDILGKAKESHAIQAFLAAMRVGDHCCIPR